MVLTTTITIPAANTNYRLADFLSGAQAGAAATFAQLVAATFQAYRMARKVVLNADDTNAGFVLIGDGGLSATNYGSKITAADTWLDEALCNKIDIYDLRVRASAINQILNVEVHYE